MNICLIVGHNKDKKGAYSKYLNVYEYDLYLKVADIIKSEVDNVDVLTRKPAPYYSTEMKGITDEINSKNYDLAIELHYNAFNNVANGVEVLYWHNSAKGKKYAESFQSILNKEGLVIRKNILIKDKTQNGAYGIMHSKCPYILVEPFFGDNKHDCDIIKSPENLARIIKEYILEVKKELI